VKNSGSKKLTTLILSLVLVVVLCLSFIFLYPSAPKNNNNLGSSAGSSAGTGSGSGSGSGTGSGSGAGNGEQSGNGTEQLPDAVDLTTLYSTMSADEYTSASLAGTTELGLSSAGNVGVEEKYFEKCMYPIPSDSEFTEEGNIVVNWQYDENATGLENFNQLNDILDSAIEYTRAGKKVKLNMPENKEIVISTETANTGVFLYEKKDVHGFYLQGNGSTIMIDYQGLQWRGLFHFFKGEEIWIENLKVDYKVPNSIRGTVVSYDSNELSVRIKIDSDCNEFVDRIKYGGGQVNSYIEFDKIGFGSKAKYIPRKNGNFFASAAVFKGYDVTGDANNGYYINIRLNKDDDGVKRAFRGAGTPTTEDPDGNIGNKVNIAFSYYTYNTFHFTECNTVKMENITVHSSVSMAFVGLKCQEIYVNRLRIQVPEGSNRLMTANADGLHIEQGQGKVVVTNSLIEYNQDDAINIKAGYWYEFSSFDYITNSITISKKTESILAPNPGDKIEIYDSSTFEYKASLTVESVVGNGEMYTIKIREPIIPLNMETWGSCVATNVSTATFVFKNNIVRNKRNRGVLCQVRGAVIENNSFINVAHGGIMTHSVLDGFNEATIPSNITIRNNKLINNNYEFGLEGDIVAYTASVMSGSAPAGTVKNITIENNFVAENGKAGIALFGVGDSLVKDNLLYNSSKYYGAQASAVFVKESKDVTFEGNYVENNLEISDFSALVIENTEDADTETIKNIKNFGLEENSGSYEIPLVKVAKVANGSISVADNSISDWSNKGTVVSIVEASYESGPKAPESEYINNFKVKQAKLTWDDDGIYVMYEIKDDLLDWAPTEQFWYGDFFELFLTTVDTIPKSDMANYRNRSGNDTMQLAMGGGWTWSGGKTIFVETSRTTTSIKQNESQVKGYVTVAGDGYYAELFLPFSLFANVRGKIEAGKSITMNMVFADNTRVGRDRVQIGNVPHNIEQNKKKTEKSVKYTFVTGE